MPAEPLAYPPDRLVRLGHAPCAQDERVLALGHRVDLGGDLEVGEPAAQLSAFAGQGFILAVIDAGGWQAGQIGVDEADLGSVNSRAGSCSQYPRNRSSEFLLSILSVFSF